MEQSPKQKKLLNLKNRLEKIKAELSSAQLLAVSKQASFDQILAAYQLGQRDFGENRVEALLERAKLAQDQGLDEIRWHFIGRLQSNKLNKLLTVPKLFAIHSIDSLKLLQKLLAKNKEIENTLFYFLQIKTSFEEEKSGLEPGTELEQALDLIRSSKDVSLLFRGLMTMAPIRTDDPLIEAQKSFEQLKQIRDAIDYPEKLELSMGMSGDYQVALEQGSDWIRLGRGLFAGE